MNAKTDELHFCVDTPTDEAIPSSCLTVRGWCFQAGSNKVRRIRIRSRQQVLEAAYGLPRPDVLAVHGHPASANCGFELSLRLETKDAQLSVEAELDSGEWKTLRTFRLRVLKQSPLDSALGRSILWLRSLFGSPKAFQSLTTTDQEYVLTKLRQRGLVGLGHLTQHAAKPVVLERFPTPRRKAGGGSLKFTIVTPSFNQAGYLRETAQSVLKQRGTRIDYVIQDGGSRDGSPQLIHELALASSQDNPNQLKHWESRPDKGQADAIAQGFKHINCDPEDIMAYLNSDDVYMPNALSFVADYFNRNPTVDVVYGHRVMIDENSDEIGRWVCPRQAFDDLALMDLIPQETLFWRKRIWDRVGGIDTHFQFAMDWDLLLRFRAAGARIVRLPYFLAMFRVHKEQKTQAWMTEHGIREMNRLRARSLDREPEPSEVAAAMRLAQFDSAFVCSVMKKGYRL